MAQAKPRILDTGIPNLDLVLGGGLQQHNSYLIVGDSGTGKSVLTQQIAFHRAKLGERILWVTGLDEPHHNLLEHLSTFQFADFRLVGPQIETVSMVPFLDRPVPEKINVLRKTVLNSRPQMVTIDGLRSFGAYSGGLGGLFEFLYGLTSWFAVEGITLLLTKETDPGALEEDPEFGMVDGVIALRREFIDGHTVRRLWVRKMRGQKALEGMHAFAIDAGGVVIWPRPQATFRLEDRPVGRGRLAFGVASLDDMLGGGLPEASTTLLAGGPGTGKTTLALAFLAGGAQRGEPGLWLGFRERRSQLLAMSEPWGVDLAAQTERGAVELVTLAPVDLDAAQVAWTLQQKLGEKAPKRLALDDVAALANAFANPRQYAEFLTWLAQFLPQQGVTSVITESMPGTAMGLSAPDTPLAVLAHNVIVVRHVEEGARLHRAIAIFKMASPDHDAAIRELILDRHGIAVGNPLSTMSTAAAVQAAEPAPVQSQF